MTDFEQSESGLIVPKQKPPEPSPPTKLPGIFQCEDDRRAIRASLQDIVHRAHKLSFGAFNHRGRWDEDHVYHCVSALAHELLGPDIEFEQLT